MRNARLPLAEVTAGATRLPAQLGGRPLTARKISSFPNNGQVILRMIHQPSAELFQFFDRLLLLKKLLRSSCMYHASSPQIC
ncbi:hypothetical protein M405DRAFT_867132 [Rhizopogon salebrosus TDB-379]|nr:hypothetical protein M405DRAFT_867132 [Rhizopogon salebrosus TDB-379]